MNKIHKFLQSASNQKPNKPFKLCLRLFLQLHVPPEDGVLQGDELLLPLEFLLLHGPDVILQVLELTGGRDHGGTDVEWINLKRRNVKIKQTKSSFWLTSIFWQRVSSFFFNSKTWKLNFKINYLTPSFFCPPQPFFPS